MVEIEFLRKKIAQIFVAAAQLCMDRHNIFQPALMDPLQGTAEVFSQDSSALEKMYLRKGKMLVGRFSVMKANLPEFLVFAFSHIDVRKEYMSSLIFLLHLAIKFLIHIDILSFYAVFTHLQVIILLQV